MPLKSTIKDLTNNLVLFDEKNSRLEGFGGLGSKVDKSLDEAVVLQSLFYLYDNEYCNNIIDLIVVDERIEMEKIVFPQDLN